MRFTVQQRPGQPPILLAEGAIDDNLVPRLEAAIDGFEGQEIWLRSPGGDDRVGTQAGRLIRQSGLRTRIPPGWACAGACNFMFIGGTDRFVDDGGVFIVHMFTLGGDLRDVDEIARASAAFATEQYDFLIRMGVSPRLLSEVMYRQSAAPRTDHPSTRRCLTGEELRRYNVVSR